MERPGLFIDWRQSRSPVSVKHGAQLQQTVMQGDVLLCFSQFCHDPNIMG